MTEQAKDKNPAKEETTELPPAVAPNRLHSGTQPPCVHRAPSDAGPEGAEAPKPPSEALLDAGLTRPHLTEPEVPPQRRESLSCCGSVVKPAISKARSL